jgi:ABC-type glycerol-3-phosphate transport system substrate-binding protein
MKKTTKLLAFLLAVLCAASAFVACGGDATVESETESTTAEGTQTEAKTEETEFYPDVEKNNYNTEFYLSIQAGGTNPIKYYWVEEGEKDAMSEALYARQMSVGDYLGV